MPSKVAENNNLVPAQPASSDEGVPTNNKKVEVHDATEKTTDVTPKQVETEHEKQVLTGTLAQKAAQAKEIAAKQAADILADLVPQQVHDFGRDYRHFANQNPVGRAVVNAPKTIFNGLNAATDPRNASRPLSAGVEAMTPAQPKAPLPQQPVKSIFNKAGADRSADATTMRRVKSAIDFAQERAMVNKAPLVPNGTRIKSKYDPSVTEKVTKWGPVPQLPERSFLTDEIAEQNKWNKEDAPDRAMFNALAPQVLGAAGNLVGSKPGGAVGHMLGQGLGLMGAFGQSAEDHEDLRDAMTRDTRGTPPAPGQPMNPAAMQRRPFDDPGTPPQAKPLPAGQPRPPVVQPPRGLGSAGLNKAGALDFGRQLAAQVGKK